MTRAQSFKAFLSCFSKENLPLTFSDDLVAHFSQHNIALPPDLIRRFILQKPTEEDDEDADLIEYVPCIKLPKTKDMHAVVYWKGGLLRHEYVLCTFDKNGVLIARKTIAGIISDGKTVTHSVATIDEDWIISIMVGHQSESDERYNPQNSQAMSMELMPNGEIIFSTQDNNE